MAQHPWSMAHTAGIKQGIKLSARKVSTLTVVRPGLAARRDLCETARCPGFARPLRRFSDLAVANLPEKGDQGYLYPGIMKGIIRRNQLFQPETGLVTGITITCYGMSNYGDFYQHSPLVAARRIRIAGDEPLSRCKKSGPGVLGWGWRRRPGYYSTVAAYWRCARFAEPHSCGRRRVA